MTASKLSVVQASAKPSAPSACVFCSREMMVSPRKDVPVLSPPTRTALERECSMTAKVRLERAGFSSSIAEVSTPRGKEGFLTRIPSRVVLTTRRSSSHLTLQRRPSATGGLCSGRASGGDRLSNGLPSAGDPNFDEDRDSVHAERDSNSSNESLPKLRASAVMRDAANTLRRKTDTFKATARAAISIFLILAILQGVLQVAFHWLLANIISHHTGLDRAYILVAPPMLWFTTMSIVWASILYWVRA